MTLTEIAIQRAIKLKEDNFLERVSTLIFRIDELELKISKDLDGISKKVGAEYLSKLQELENLFNEKLSRIPLTPGVQGKEGPTGPIGKEGQRGKDGKNGQPGLNGLNGKNGKDGSSDKPHDLAIKLNTLKGKVNMSVIDGLEEKFKGFLTILKNYRGKQSGGGDVVEAGTGISITRTSGGKRSISTTSTGISILTPTSGVINGINQTFVFTTAPTILYVDNKALQKVSSNGEVNWTGTTTVILTVAPNRDIYGLG